MSRATLIVRASLFVIVVVISGILAGSAAWFFSRKNITQKEYEHIRDSKLYQITRNIVYTLGALVIPSKIWDRHLFDLFVRS